MPHFCLQSCKVAQKLSDPGKIVRVYTRFDEAHRLVLANPAHEIEYSLVEGN